MNGPQRQPGLSFNLYPGLDQALDEALVRNGHGGNSGAPSAEHDLAAAAAEAMGRAAPDSGATPEAGNWATAELQQAGSSWERFANTLDANPPNTIEDHLMYNPEFGQCLNYLHEAKTGLAATGETTPGGIPIGDTLKLTLVPWKGFLDNLDRLPDWIKELRDIQGAASDDDFINSDLVAALQGGEAVYRNPRATQASQAEPIWISARQYLDQRIAKEGPWGVILAQASEEAGIDRLKGVSPDDMTREGQAPLELAGYQVDGMGIFEWLALTLQEDPTKLSPRDYSWLLANRLGGQVAYGVWYDGRVGSVLGSGGDAGSDDRPRLAVNGFAT